MVDFSSLIQAAHGGDVVGNLAQQFGLSPEQAQAAISALAPALAHGLQNQLQSSDGVGAIVDHLNDPTHQDAYNDPAAAQSPQAAAAGSDLLNQLFGSAGVGQIAQHIAAETGIDANTLNSLMPVLASVAAGGVSKAMNEGGFGGLLSQVGGASGQGGGLGGVLGGLVGSLFGGKAQDPAAEGAPAAGGLDPALLQAGMGALGNLFQSAQASGGLQNILGQIFAKR